MNPIHRPTNTTVFPTLTAVRLARTVIEPIAAGVRDGFMLGLPVRVTEGMAVGMPVRVGVGMPVRVGEGVGVCVLVAAKAPVVPPESSATDRTPAPSARP